MTPPPTERAAHYVLVDVVIPVYNARATAPTTVAAVLGQLDVAAAAIVVDDGSIDGTAEIIRDLHGDDVVIVSQENGGPAAARNLGASTGTAEWIAFLDADMTPEPSWLRQMLDAATPDTQVVGCEAVFLRDGTVVENDQRGTLRGDEDGLPPFIPGRFLIRRALFDQVGGYDAELRYSENSDLNMRATAASHNDGHAAAFIAHPLVTVVDTPDGRSRQLTLDRRLKSAERVLANNADFLRNHRRAAANYSAIAGVTALKLGQPARARPHLRRALRLDPRRLSWWLNAAIAHVGLSRRPGNHETR